MDLKIKLPYHWRLFVILLCVSWGLALCFVLFQYGREKRFKAEALNSKLQIVNTHVADALSNRIPYDSMMKYSLNNQLRLTLIKDDGRVLFDSYEGADYIFMPNHSDRPEVILAQTDGSGYTVRRLSSSTSREYFYSALNGDSVIIRSALPYDVSLVKMLEADRGFIWVMVIAMFAICLIGYFTMRRLGQNVVRLREFARMADKGEMIDPTTHFSKDELGDISNHIVQIYSQLQRTTAERDREHEQALHQEQEKIRIKKQLTNNINHELKTPVAAIQGYIETILTNPTMPEELKQQFLEKSQLQTHRLHRLLQDISAITRMDEASHLITGDQRISLNELIEEISSDIALLPKERQLVVHCNFNKEVVIYGNASLIGSIFRNLTDNATAYSMGHDIFINLIGETESHYTFSIADNGVGVGKEHLERIFERFYRVDKGRSRKIGGTGLGLSIVRNAVVLHGGQIEVCNSKHGGLEFTFTLRKKS